MISWPCCQISTMPAWARNMTAIMYAGLSPEAMLKLCDLYVYDSDCSYAIFDGDKQSAAGDWEDADAGLYWSPDSPQPLGSASSQAH